MLADPALEHTFHPDTRCRKEQMDSHVDYTCFSSLPIVPLLHDLFLRSTVPLLTASTLVYFIYAFICMFIRPDCSLT